MSRALVIVDMQANAFMPPRSAYRIEEVAALLDGKAAEARAAGVPVIFIQHEETEGDWKRGSAGWAFDPRVAPKAGDTIVAKSHCDAFWDTNFAETLEELGVDALIIGGYASDYCVDTTIRAAASRGYAVTVIADGHTTSERPHLPAAAIVEHHGRIWTDFDPRVSIALARDIQL